MKVLWITNILFAHHRTMMGMDNKVVADRFLRLIDNLAVGKETEYLSGPCSKAIPIKKRLLWKNK